MRKKLLGITVLAAALTLATGITAFAGTWKEDVYGRYYENDDGTRPVYAGWFTDPADGVIYGMNPDGYVMINSDMGTYRTDDQGRRIEPTEEELQRAAERQAVLATRPSPAKKQAAADVAAKAAKSATAASSTTRSSYQAEMKVFMEKFFNEAKSKRTDTSIKPDSNEDNTVNTYAFKNPDGYRFITATIWKSSKTTAVNYKEHAFEMSYHFDAAASDTDRAIYDNAYNQMVIAALGDTEGPAALDYIQTERNNGSASFDRTGTTDTGNTYRVTYRNGLATFYITCSEVVAGSEAAADTEAAEAAEADTAAETSTVSSSVIVAGQSAATEDNSQEAADDTADGAADTTDNAAGDTAAE